jgi:hypothetical protein
MYLIEIVYNKNQDWFELWQHSLNYPEDILFPIKYSNFIDFNKNKKLLMDRAIRDFNIKYNQIRIK